MEFLQRILPFGPAATIVLALVVVHVLLSRRPPAEAARLRRQLGLIGTYLLAAVAVVVVLPLSEELRGQLLALLGLLVSAAITLSSTSLVGNAMAGLMLRAVRNFQAGDFVVVGEHFGRVSDRGLLHVEIQTEDRDLVTLPNLYLVTNPVKVVRRTGTVVSATVSLGYDTAWNHIEVLLAQAATEAGLEEPFVQILELGDFSVTYRAAGFLTEVRTLITARSRLRAAMLDVLHAGGVEIVSPTFMNQRPIGPGQRFVPPVEPVRPLTDGLPEDVVFDKADQAQAQEFLARELESLGRRHADLCEERDKMGHDRLRAHLEHEISTVEQRRARVEAMLKGLSDQGQAEG